jgi:amino acid transporter
MTNDNKKDSSKSHLHRDLGVVGLSFFAIGTMIGSAWLFGALYAAQEAGPASIIAWAIGGLLIAIIALSYAELGTMFPVAGGVVRYPDFAYGSFTSYTFGWVYWLACASSTTIEVMAALQYAKSYLPWLQYLDKSGNPTLSAAGFAVAIGLLALFALINVLGIRWIRRLNNALVWWKLGMILLVISAFLYTVFHGSHFSDASAGGFFPNGWAGIFSAVSTAGIAFSFVGFRHGVDLAGETHNPGRYVPYAVVGSILVVTLLYIGLQIAFIGSLPLNALANGWANIGNSFTGELNDVAATFGPLAAIAGFIGLTWLAALLYIDAFISPADTALILTTVTARVSYAMGRNRNAPKSLSKVNKRGVPWVSVILTFIAGVIFLFLFPGWNQLVGFITAAVVLNFGTGPLVLLVLRRELPQIKRPFQIPWVYVITYLGFLATNLIFYWTGWTKIWKLMIAVIIGLAIFIIHEIVNREETPPLELRSGVWMIVWFCGLTIISWLGTYPELSKHAGNLGLISTGWGIPVLAVFSLFIMWLAIKDHLPAEKMEKNMETAIEEMESENNPGHQI